MKIFFSMTHPGYIRNYESTLRLLARRGHGVHLYFFFKSRMGENKVLDRICREHPEITCSTSKPRRSARLDLARMLRVAVDVLRYRDPRYRGASKLRARAEDSLPGSLRWLFMLPLWSLPAFARLVSRGLIFLERGLPPCPGILAAVASEDPDLVLVTPLVDIGSDQVEVVKCARALGLPSMLLVHSWDNLTNKGLIRLIPDRVAVWNEEQTREAVTLHGVDASRIVVTGAPSYDHWFEWKARRDREEFCRLVGLVPAKPIILYLCSSTFITPKETPFVEDWIRRIRSCADPVLREAGILIRPHPQNAKQWESFDALGHPNVAVWPRGGRNPIDEDSRAEYYDSIFHSAAVVGVNTSAQIEAGIVGRRVFTLLTPEFESTQVGTLHFHHLLEVEGGLLSVARDFEEHLKQLGVALRASRGDASANRQFLENFVRPRGLDAPATPVLVDAIEELSRSPRFEPRANRFSTLVAKLALAPVLVALRLGRRLGKLVWGGGRGRAVDPGPVAIPSGERDATPGACVREVGAGPQTPEEPVAGKSERRLLFVMLHPGYLRYYDSTLRILARRGWRITLAFNQPRKQTEDGLAEGLAEDCGVECVKSPTWAPGLSASSAKFVRNLRDYLRYTDPRYASAPLLRARMELRIQRPVLALVRFLERFLPFGLRALAGLLTLAERAVPSSSTLESFLESRKIDLVLVTPLVNMGSQQVDWVKSARALGIPTGLCVASWDNLTNKGLVKIATERVLVWNEIQKDEAIRLHGVRPSTVLVTGAARFDEWFLAAPSRSREALARDAGLPDGRPYVLYLCSSPFVGRGEVAFVDRWIRALRGAADPAVSRLAILIRPHPQNAAPWRDVDVSNHEAVAIWPREGANPVLPSARADFFDAIYHAEAVVGLNTSAFLDAGIHGVPTFTVVTPETAATQEGTLHFRYLLREEGGLLRVAANLEDHVRDLARSQAARDADRAQVRNFVERFLRPHGIDVPCAPITADAIEGILEAPPIQSPLARRLEWMWTWPLRALLAPLACGVYAAHVRRRGRRADGEEGEQASVSVAARE